MSRLISDILSAQEPDFSNLVQEWETLSGRRGLDVHLALEIDKHVSNVLTALRLDKDDSTSRELYHALQSRAARDAERLANHLKVYQTDTPEMMAGKAIKFVHTLIGSKDVWAVKASVIKRLLRVVPPKKLMKINGQRSIDSVIKRESPIVLLALSALTEPPAWATKFYAQYKKLKVSDFDYQPLQTPLLLSKQRAALRQNDIDIDQLLLPVRELGSVVVVPPKKRFPADTLVLVYLLLDSWRETRLHGAFYKALATKPKFGEAFMRTIKNDIHTISTDVFGVRWSALHSLSVRDKNPQDFEPGLEAEELAVPTPQVVLSQYLPDFTFWDCHFVALQTGNGPVSCHLGDVITNVANQNTYERRVAQYVQSNLWDELYARYLSHPAVAQKVLK